MDARPGIRGGICLFNLKINNTMNKNYIIRHETESDYRTVENLCREAFWMVSREFTTPRSRIS